MEIEIKLNDKEILRLLDAAAERALVRCGREAQGRARDLAPIDTGNLRQKIDYKVQGDEVHIGTNVEYAAYVELGTGIHYPGGRQTPWVFQDSKGEWHMTNGQRAQPFLKPAVADNVEQYLAIIKDELSK